MSTGDTASCHRRPCQQPGAFVSLLPKLCPPQDSCRNPPVQGRRARLQAASAFSAPSWHRRQQLAFSHPPPHPDFSPASQEGGLQPKGALSKVPLPAGLGGAGSWALLQEAGVGCKAAAALLQRCSMRRCLCHWRMEAGTQQAPPNPAKAGKNEMKKKEKKKSRSAILGAPGAELTPAWRSACTKEGLGVHCGRKALPQPPFPCWNQ